MSPAHHLIEAGLHVFPLVGKVPPGGHGYLDATAGPVAFDALQAARPHPQTGKPYAWIGGAPT